MEQAKKQLNQTKVNLAVDAGIFVGFLIADTPHFTGMAIHEWLGIAFGAAVITHLLLHWRWIVAITQRFFSKTTWQARLNYILNLLLFVDFTVIILSGLMISREALPFLGISLEPDRAWSGLHHLSTNLSLVLLGLHLALHWQWIVKAIKRYVIEPLRPARPISQPHMINKLTHKEV